MKMKTAVHSLLSVPMALFAALLGARPLAGADGDAAAATFVYRND